jgi:hypothetical protein
VFSYTVPLPRSFVFKHRAVIEILFLFSNTLFKEVRRMASSGLLRRVALVRTDVSEEPGASFIRVAKIDELGTTRAATSNRRTLRRNTKVGC